MKKKLFARLLVMMLTISLLLGSTLSMGIAEAVDYDPDAVITVALNTGWDSLCSLASTTSNADMAISTIFDPLVKPDGKGGWANHLAESFEFVDDNTAIVFHLRRNAKWHDGEPFDADDVIFTTNLVANGSYTSSRRLFLQNMVGTSASGVEESAGSTAVEKIDQYTVKYTLKTPMSPRGAFSQAHCFFILPEHLLKDVDPAKILESDFWVNPIGTGAFIYESQVPGESLTVVSNTEYYLGAPKYAKLVLRVMPASNVLTSMMTGEVDVINGTTCSISDTDMEMAQSIPGYKVQGVEATSMQYLIVNSDTFPTAKIRKALAMLLDRDTMIQAAAGGNASYMNTMYARTSTWYDPEVDAEYGYTFDPETAVQMLKEEGFDFDRTYIVCINDLPVRQSMMVVMQQTWAQYGMKLEIKTLDTQTCIATIRAGDCDFWISGNYSADFDGINAWLMDWCTINEDGSLGPFNLARVREPEMMNLFSKLYTATEEADIRALTSELQKLVLTDYYYIWTISPFINQAISERLQGYESLAIMGYMNWHEWYVAK
jgi:peptide/nickel transport system substrate-binding protein